MRSLAASVKSQLRKVRSTEVKRQENAEVAVEKLDDSHSKQTITVKLTWSRCAPLIRDAVSVPFAEQIFQQYKSIELLIFLDNQLRRIHSLKNAVKLLVHCINNGFQSFNALQGFVGTPPVSKALGF